MFGRNPIRKSIAATTDGQTLAVQEIFDTIQGEGPLAGQPCVFIRLAGCNLACKFCDTEFETKIDNLLSVDQIVAQTTALRHHGWVVLTGGEPMRQNVVPLCEALAARGRHVQIETAGNFWVPEEWQGRFEHLLHEGDVSIVVSPKTAHVPIETSILALARSALMRFTSSRLRTEPSTSARSHSCGSFISARTGE